MNRCELIARHPWLGNAPLTLDFLEGLGDGIYYSVRLIANARQRIGRDLKDALGRSTVAQVYLPHAAIALLVIESAGELRVHDDLNTIFCGTGRDLAPRVVNCWATGKLRGS